MIKSTSLGCFFFVRGQFHYKIISTNDSNKKVLIKQRILTHLFIKTKPQGYVSMSNRTRRAFQCRKLIKMVRHGRQTDSGAINKRKIKGTPGIEPGTSRSAVECSTPELYPRCYHRFIFRL